MSSISRQPIPQIPPIESLAPPLPESNAADVPVAQSAPPKDESWVPVEGHAENTESASPGADSDSETGNNGAAKIAIIEPAAGHSSATLFSRVMKQRATVLPQTAHVQKDNTLAIFVTLCLVVVAIACGIYFVADRETQIQGPVTSGPVTANSVVPNSVSQLPPPAGSLQSSSETTHSKSPSNFKSAQPAAVPKEKSTLNPLFGNPVKKPAASSTSSVKHDKTTQLLTKSQEQLSSMQYIEAEYSARRATELKPSSSDAWLALGRALYCQGRYSEAERAFKLCVKRGAGSKAAQSAADFISEMPAPSQNK